MSFNISNDGFEGNAEGLMQKGNKIHTLYNDYMAQKRLVNTIKERVSKAWSGADSTGCVTAMDSYDKDFEDMGAVMDKVGEVLYNHGQRLADSMERTLRASSKL